MNTKDVKVEYKIEGRDSTIFRVMKNKDNPYVMIDRRPIDNPRLSFRAKGVLTYLLSRPDGWEVNIGDLENHGVEGRDALRSTLTELREAGHLEYQQKRESGKFSTGKILVYEVPISEPQRENPYTVALEGVPQTDNPYTAKPRAANPTQVLSTLSSNELSNKTTTTTANNFSLYESNIGPLTPLIADALKDAEKTYSLEWVSSAILEAAKSNVRNLKYIEGVLKGYKERGGPKIGRVQVRERKKSKAAEATEALAEYAREQGWNNGN